MKSKIFTAFSFALLFSLAFAFSANAQDASQTKLPKFKKNALSLYLIPSCPGEMVYHMGPRT